MYKITYHKNKLKQEGGIYVKENFMYQITLSLKERQELVRTLSQQINYLRAEKKIHQMYRKTIKVLDVEERIAHLENIKEKVEQARIVPIKGLTE